VGWLLLIVAILVLSTDHVTPVVISDCELSLKLAVAWNCWVAVCEIVPGFGVTTIDKIDGGFTVKLAVPVNPLEVAVMLALPGIRPTANPALFTVATVGVPEDQVAVLVMV
jgi:hypothetical protein